jgi:membrane-bound lytic murein transglycosylase A
VAEFEADPVQFSSLILDANQCFEAVKVFNRMAQYLLGGKQMRSAVPPVAGLKQLFEAVAQKTVKYPDEAKEFFLASFTPYKIRPKGNLKGFVTGYFEPQVMAERKQSLFYRYPILSRPQDMRKRLRPRSEIDLNIEEYQPLAWVRDPIEAFMIQVQGSAILQFDNGSKHRLTFDGRNGHPYVSIGKLLIESGEISLSSMSIETLKNWVRGAGQRIGEKGRNLLWMNDSYVFFRLLPLREEDLGPIGGAGVALTPLVSLATDRNIWPYATPFLIKGDLSSARSDWANFQRLMVSQDTGSAIIGPARGDIFIGTGENAGKLASRIQHEVDFIVFLPR